MTTEIKLPKDLARDEILQILGDDSLGLHSPKITHYPDKTVGITLSESTAKVLDAIDTNPTMAIRKLVYGSKEGVAALERARARVSRQIHDAKQQRRELKDRRNNLVNLYKNIGNLLRTRDSAANILGDDDIGKMSLHIQDKHSGRDSQLLHDAQQFYAPKSNDLALFSLHSKNHRPLPSEFAVALFNLAETYKQNPSFENWLDDDMSNMDDEAAYQLLGTTGDRYTIGLLASCVQEAQVFEFGIVEDARLKKEALRAGPLFGKGHIKLPFTAVIYWYTFRGEEETYKKLNLPTNMMDLRYATVAVDASRVGLRSKGRLLFIADFIEAGPGITIDTGKNANDYRTAMYLSSACFADIKDDGYFNGRLLEGVTKTRDADEKALDGTTLGGMVDGVVGLSLILATKGIPTRREEPSPKLNAKRARSNKPPLVSVTYIDTARYAQAARNTDQGGTHATPVPHLRRGHPHHFWVNDKAAANGKRLIQRWLPDMLVNCRDISEVKERDRYEVKK